MKMLYVMNLAVFSLTLPVTTRPAEPAHGIGNVVSASMQYDALNRLTNVTYSNGHRLVYQYDKVGNLVRQLSFDPAKISTVSNLTVTAGKKTEVAFQVNHFVLPIQDISVFAFSSNQGLISNNRLKVVGAGTNRVLKINTDNDKSGKALISLVSSDGFVKSTNSFTLTVLNKPPKK